MRKRFSLAHLTIAQRLTMGFALAGLLSVITALAVGIANTATFQQSTQSFNQALRGSLNLSEIRFDLEDIHSTLDDRLAFRSQANQTPLSSQIVKLSDDLDARFVDTLTLIGQDVPEFVAFDLSWATYRQLSLNAAFLLDSGHQDQINLATTTLANEGQTAYNTTIKDLAAMVTLNQQRVEATQASASQSNQNVFWGALALALIGFLVLMALAWLIVSSIIRQLNGLLRLTRLVKEGDLNQRFDVAGRNEVAVVASSMNDMLDTITSLLGREESLRRELEEQIEYLVAKVTPVGQGDLRLQAEVSDLQLGVLADVFNLIVEQLATLVARVQNSAAMTFNAAGSIVRQASELIQSTGHQEAQLAQVKEGMSQLAVAAGEVARLARTAAGTASETVSDAQRGGQTTLEVLERIKRGTEQVRTIEDQMQVLSSHSKEITSVVALIEGIAQQTRLLSFNAEVQAEQASSELSRGFSVVAEEIRRLAERTEDAIHRITTLLRTVQGDIYSVTKTTGQTALEFNDLEQLSDEARQVLQAIWTGITQQAQDIEAITEVAVWQESVAGMVAGMVRDLTAMAKSMGEIARGQETAAHNLSDISQALQASISAFRLPAQVQQQGLLPGRQDTTGQFQYPQISQRSGRF